jgi:hypothetical protein
MDKKMVAAATVTILLFGGLTAASVFVFLKPSGESGAKSKPSAFPGARAGAVRPASESVERIPAPSDWGAASAAPAPVRGARPRPGGGSSLGFIKKDESFIGGDAKKKAAADAAARGDAKALVEGLRQSRDRESGSLSDKAVRAIMQKVVDRVKERQPRWYRQFLANRNLKAIADRYDKDSDFETFVRLLSKSTPFKSMLKLKSKKPAMRELTWSLIGDDSIGPSLKQILLEKRENPHLVGLLKNYGKGAGIPPDMLEAAGVAVSGKSSRKKRRSARRSRPKLRKRGFSGFERNKEGSVSPEQSSGETPELPAGVDPAMLEHYKKYMKK